MGNTHNGAYIKWRKWWHEGMPNAVSSPFAKSNFLSLIAESNFLSLHLLFLLISIVLTSINVKAVTPNIDAGHNYTVALKADGTVWTWGSNYSYKLGVYGLEERSSPNPVSGLNKVIAVAAGSNHVVALKADGRVWTWGSNSEGQLGYSTFYDNPPNHLPQYSPTPVAGLDDVIAVAAGLENSVALKADGTVWAWGRNNEGQLGYAPADDYPYNRFFTPTPVPGLQCGVRSPIAH